MDNKQDRNLTDRCQYLVWTQKDVAELESLLKNAPVRLNDEFSEDIINVAFFYLFDSSILRGLKTFKVQQDGCEVQEQDLSKREFDAVIEYNIDATQWIERNYKSSRKHDFYWLKNNNGKSMIGVNHLEILCDKAEDIQVAESNKEGMVFVGYRQNGKNYLIYFQLSDIFYPHTDG